MHAAAGWAMSVAVAAAAVLMGVGLIKGMGFLQAREKAVQQHLQDLRNVVEVTTEMVDGAHARGDRLAWVLPSVGSISDFELQTMTLAPVRDGDVRVRVKAVGLNFADVFTSIGLYEASARTDCVPGLEFAGVVSASKAPGVHIGDRVYGVTRFGAYSTSVTVKAEYVRPLPEGWSFEEGASFMVQALTAWHAIDELGHMKDGAAVLIQSVAGGVGLQALEIVRRLGGWPVGTVSQERKADFLVEEHHMPREDVIVRTTASEFGGQLDRVLEKEGREGFDLVLESLGGQWFTAAYERMRPTGLAISFGVSSYMSPQDTPNWLHLTYSFLTRPKVDPMKMIGENKGVVGFNLIWLTDRIEELNAEVDKMLATGKFPAPHVSQPTFSFGQLPHAVRTLQGGGTIGKVVVTVP